MPGLATFFQAVPFWAKTVFFYLPGYAVPPQDCFFYGILLYLSKSHKRDTVREPFGKKGRAPEKRNYETDLMECKWAESLRTEGLS